MSSEVPLPEDPFLNPFWSALTTEQAGFAVGNPPALRYPADIIPFVALETISRESLLDLRHLLDIGEGLFLTADTLPNLTPFGLEGEPPFAVLQMRPDPSNLPSQREEDPSPAPVIRQLTAADAAAMVGLTDVAFPGFFRSRTYRLGRYFGIDADGQLIAMAGERAAFAGFRELSAVCTHPAHTGRGYAARLIKHLLQVHAQHGEKSFLHVTASNSRAVRLYRHLGFYVTGSVNIHRLRRRS